MGRSRKEMGLCHWCGKPPRPGRSLCEDCAAKGREAQRRSRQRKAESGLCLQCSDKAEPGKNLCAKHLESQRRRNRECKMSKDLTSIHVDREVIANLKALVRGRDSYNTVLRRLLGLD